MQIEITEKTISLADVLSKLKLEGAGALVTFSGIIRALEEGKELERMEYEAYKEMAKKEMRKIAAEIRARWGISDIAMLHKVGQVAVGEPSVIIAVAAEHRREAFRACEYAIDKLKEVVPIWKKAVFKVDKCASSQVYK